MKARTLDQYSNSLLRKYLLALAVWSVLIAASLAWNIYQEYQERLSNAAVSARACISKDIAFLKWVASFGGIYIPHSGRIPPNPYFKTPKRDVVAAAGDAFTLLSPPYALHDIQNKFGDDHGTLNRITSLKPFNSVNAANAWEASALVRFEQGIKEAVEMQQLDGKPYLKVMWPLVVEPDCLNCHAQRGHKLGDILGGISASVPFTPYLAEQQERIATLIPSYGLIWLLGLLGGGISYRRERSSDEKRKVAEIQLLENEQKYRTLADSGQALIWGSGSDKLCHYFNKRWLEFTGRSIDQEIGNGWAEGVHPDDYQHCLDVYVSAFDRREMFSMEYRLRRHNGEYGWLQDDGCPRYDSNGEFIGYIGYCLDISEHKRVEEKLARYAHDMGERVKEISCLRDITALSLKKNRSVESILDSCVRRIPDGWLDPSRTCARIRLDGKTFETPNFQETAWKLAAKIPVSLPGAAVVEVFYMGDGSEVANNPFLDEEHHLINSIATQLGLSLERRWAEEQLKHFSIELEQANSIMADDLLFAENIMSYIMRSEELSDPQIRYLLRPTKQFSGDIISAARDDKGDLRVMLADVTGHGLQAALFLQRTFRIFHAMAKKGLPTSDIVTEINQFMREIAVPGHFIAAVVAHIAHDCSSIEIWNGGIPTAFYVQKNGELHQFISRHPPLGVVNAAAFEATTEIFHAKPGALLISSDGLTEAEDASGKPFGDDQLESILRTSQFDDIFDNVLAALENHLGGNIAHDDLSIVLARCGD